MPPGTTKSQKKRLLDNLIYSNKINLGFCIICKKKNCNKDCAYFGNRQFFMLILENINHILENEKTPLNINIKKIIKNLKDFALEDHKREMGEIEQTKFFYEVYRQINKRLNGRLGPQP